MNAKEATNGVLITCVEIKITKSDFKSKHGHNFCGNCNYYAMPKELYPEVKDLIPEGVGVLLFYGAAQSDAQKKDVFDFSYYGIKTKVQPAYQAAGRRNTEMAHPLDRQEDEERSPRCVRRFACREGKGARRRRSHIEIRLLRTSRSSFFMSSHGCACMLRLCV